MAASRGIPRAVGLIAKPAVRAVATGGLPTPSPARAWVGGVRAGAAGGEEDGVVGAMSPACETTHEAVHGTNEAFEKTNEAFNKEFATFNTMFAAFNKEFAACERTNEACNKEFAAFERTKEACNKEFAACERTKEACNIVSKASKFVLKAGFQREKRENRTSPRGQLGAKSAPSAPANAGTPFLSRTMSVEALWRPIEGRASAPAARAWRPQPGTSRAGISFPPPAPLSRSAPPLF